MIFNHKGHTLLLKRVASNRPARVAQAPPTGCGQCRLSQVPRMVGWDRPKQKQRAGMGLMNPCLGQRAPLP